MPDDEIVPIPDWKAKLRFLKNDSDAQQVGRHTGSEPDFAKAIGEARSTVNGWLDPNGTRRAGIPGATNRRIVERFRFPANWEPWLLKDAGVFKEEFSARARNLLGKLEEPPPPVRDTMAPLMQGDDRDPERCPIRSLASLELSCGQTQAGQTNVGAHISCGFSPVEGSPFPITVHTAQLEIECGKARAVKDTIKGYAESGFTASGSRGEVRAMWNGGDTQKLAWLLDATSTSLGVVTFEPGTLARVERMAPGDVITGSLGTWLKNIEEDQNAVRSAEEIAIVDRLGKAVELRDSDLTILQRRIVEHLRKRVLEVDDSGYAILARHELHFVGRP